MNAGLGTHLRYLWGDAPALPLGPDTADVPAVRGRTCATFGDAPAVLLGRHLLCHLTESYPLLEIHDGFGAAHTVEGGADDAAGVAGTFAAGEEAGDFGMLQVVWIPRDADR